MLTKTRLPSLEIMVVDQRAVDDLPNGVTFVKTDGVEWLVDNLHRNSGVEWIIPALPVHLAALWVKEKIMRDGKTLDALPIPPWILEKLPNPYQLSKNSYALSYADFLCPPDCSEPDECCTVTGRVRPTPLYDLVGSLCTLDHKMFSLQSQQIGPGFGGLRPDSLWRLLDGGQSLESGSFLISTSCKCHGLITGYRL